MTRSPFITRFLCLGGDQNGPLIDAMLNRVPCQALKGFDHQLLYPYSLHCHGNRVTLHHPLQRALVNKVVLPN